MKKVISILFIVFLINTIMCACNPIKPDTDSSNTDNKNILGLNSSKSLVKIKEIKENDDYQYCVMTDDSIVLTKYYGADTSVVIPDTIDNIPIKIISGSCFTSNTGVQKHYNS